MSWLLAASPELTRSQAVSARDSVGGGWDSGTGDGQGKAVKIIRCILNKARTGLLMKLVDAFSCNDKTTDNLI